MVFRAAPLWGLSIKMENALVTKALRVDSGGGKERESRLLQIHGLQNVKLRQFESQAN